MMQGRVFDVSQIHLLFSWLCVLPPGQPFFLQLCPNTPHLVPVALQCHHFPGESDFSPSRVTPLFSTLGY